MKYLEEFLILFFIIIGVIYTLQGKRSGAFDLHDIANINVIPNDDSHSENNDAFEFTDSIEDGFLCWGEPCDPNSIFAQGLTEDIDYQINDFKYFLTTNNTLKQNKQHKCYVIEESKVFLNLQMKGNSYSIVNPNVCLSLLTQAYKETNEGQNLTISFWGYSNNELSLKSKKLSHGKLYPKVLRTLEFKQINNQIFLNSDTGYLVSE